MGSVLGHRVGSRRTVELEDERLATLVHSGDEAAFEVLYDRHHASLLAFCRHMLSSREDGEDALQQTFVRAHRALRAGRLPDAVRPWLFAIARNRCRTMLVARREAAVAVEDHEPGFDGLADDVRRRAELRELVADLGRLPDDQREALVLFELGDLSHAEIAATIGCPPAKVKALVFQARTSLIAERDARGTPCEEIRDQLEVARGGVLRRGSLRRHLRQCEPCRAYGGAVSTQRAGLAWVLPVVPTAGLKAAVLAGVGLSGGAGTAAAALAVGEAVSLGAAATGGGAAATGGGVAASAAGFAVKGLVAKVAITMAVGAGAAGAVAAVDHGGTLDPAKERRAETAQRASVAEHQSPPRRTERARGARVIVGAGALRRPAGSVSIRRRGTTLRTRRVAARRLTRARTAPRRTARRLVRAQVAPRRVARRLRHVALAPRRTLPTAPPRLRRRTDDASLRTRRRPRIEAAVRRATHVQPGRGRPGRRRR
jgi:RNA polymerase sigma factor (sigma-70 family)